MKKNKKSLAITLGAALTIVLALTYNSANMGPRAAPAGAPGGTPSGTPSGSPNGAAGPAVGQGKPGAPGPSVAPQVKPVELEAAPPKRAELKMASSADLPSIGVVEVTTSTHQAVVSGYGEVQPFYTLDLTARVSGQIESLAAEFVTGARFEQGQVLAYVDSTDYQQALASAKALYEEASIALEEERLQGMQAKDEWQRSGLSGDPTSSLVLREPYLQAAKATLEESQAQLASARRDLHNTAITSPFNSVVVTRNIQPGSYVQAGTTVATLYSTDSAEIAIPLSAAQWRNLPAVLDLKDRKWAVTLRDMDGLYEWQGEVTRVEQHLDTASRQRSAIVQVSQPLDQAAPLFFGTYVVATIEGKQWDAVWQIPASAISQKLNVWYVDEQQKLARFTPEILFQDSNYAYITPVENLSRASIVVRPLNSYTVGTKVRPVLESAHE